MSARFAFASTFAAVLLVNGLVAGAVTQSVAKNTKRHDKKPAVSILIASSHRTLEKKKDGDKKKELILAATTYQPALMKPASLRCRQRHRHYRYSA